MPMVFKTIIIVAALVCATLVDPEGAKVLIKKVLDKVVSHGKVLPKKQPKHTNDKSLNGVELRANGEIISADLDSLRPEDFDYDEYLSELSDLQKKK